MCIFCLKGTITVKGTNANNPINKELTFNPISYRGAFLPAAYFVSKYFFFTKAIKLKLSVPCQILIIIIRTFFVFLITVILKLLHNFES